MGPVTGEQQWDMVRVSKEGDTIEELEPNDSGGIVRSYSPARNPPGPYRPYTLLLEPKGTAGAFEKVTFEPGTVTWNPTGLDPIVFAFRDSAGRPGVSLISKKEIQL